MSLIIDIIVLIVIILFIVSNYNKGFIKSLYNIVSLFLSIIFTKISYPIVSNLLKSSIIFDKISLFIINTLKIEDKLNFLIKDNYEMILEKFDFFNFNSTKFLESFNFNKDINLSLAEQNISNYISSKIIDIISFIMVFLLTLLILKILGKFLNFAFSLPMLNTLNKILGAIWGGLKAILIVWTLFIIIYLLSFNPFFENIKIYIENSNLSKFLYKNNYLLFLMLNYFYNLLLKII